MHDICLTTFAEYCEIRLKTTQGATEYHHNLYGIPVMAAWYFGDVMNALASNHDLPPSEKFSSDVDWLHEQQIKFSVSQHTIFLYDISEIARFKLARL